MSEQNFCIGGKGGYESARLKEEYGTLSVVAGHSYDAYFVSLACDEGRGVSPGRECRGGFLRGGVCGLPDLFRGISLEMVKGASPWIGGEGICGGQEKLVVAPLMSIVRRRVCTR